MTEVENQTLNLLKILIENRQEIYERLAPRVNIVNILGNTYYEVQNSKLLHCIFNAHFKYYDKEINFAKDFALYFVNKNYKNEIKEAKFESVHTEFTTKEGRKIDILIVFDKFEIIIENKINAGDQENQLADYYIDRNNGKLIFLVYLTRFGYGASEYSIGKEIKEELKDKIYYLSHGDIAEWIEEDILNKYEFLKFDKKYQSICSALIQIRDNEKIITNPNRENNMEKEEIKNFFEENKYFENLLNKDEPIEYNFNKLNEFYKFLENAQRVIVDKKVELVSDDINYSLKVIEFIKSVQYNKDEDYMKGASFYSREEIIGSVLKTGGYSRNIDIPIENTNCSIRLLQHVIYPLCASVYYKNNDIANKLREETIKTEIGKILDKDSDIVEYPDGYLWFYYPLYIGTKKYEPEEVGQKIIDLYDFLKEKIAQ